MEKLNKELSRVAAENVVLDCDRSSVRIDAAAARWTGDFFLQLAIISLTRMFFVGRDYVETLCASLETTKTEAEAYKVLLEMIDGKNSTEKELRKCWKAYKPMGWGHGLSREGIAEYTKVIRNFI